MYVTGFINYGPFLGIINFTKHCKLLLEEEEIKGETLHKKRPLKLEVFFGFTKKCFLVSTNSEKTTPSHFLRICHIFLLCGSGEWNVT